MAGHECGNYPIVFTLTSKWEGMLQILAISIHVCAFLVPYSLFSFLFFGGGGG